VGRVARAPPLSRVARRLSRPRAVVSRFVRCIPTRSSHQPSPKSRSFALFFSLFPRPLSSLYRPCVALAFASRSRRFASNQPLSARRPATDPHLVRDRPPRSRSTRFDRASSRASHARAHDRVAISNDSLKSVVCRAIDSPTSATSFERVDDRIDRSIATSARTRMVDQSLTVTPNAELPFACTSPIDDECEKCEERERDVDRATREKRTQKGTRETGVDEGDDRWDDRGSRAGARLNGARARSREE